MALILPAQHTQDLVDLLYAANEQNQALLLFSLTGNKTITLYFGTHFNSNQH